MYRVTRPFGNSTMKNRFKSYVEPFELKTPIDLHLTVFKIQGNEIHRERVIRVLQDIFELVTSDMMTNGSRFVSSSMFLFRFFQMFCCPIFHFAERRVLDLVYASEQIEQDFIDFSRHIEPQLFESSSSKESIHFPLPDDDSLIEQVKFINFLFQF